MSKFDFVDLIKSFMTVAEATLENGKVKKAYVKKMMKEALAKHDIAWLPNSLETVAEDVLVDVTIEIVWALVFRGK